MDQNSLRDAPLLRCTKCGHLDSAEYSNIGINGVCSLCDPDIGCWHNRFERKLPASSNDPIPDSVVDRVLSEHPEYHDTVFPKEQN